MYPTTPHPKSPFTDLSLTDKLVFSPLGLKLQYFALESESQEYNACRFELNDKKVVYRSAKITPTKTGQFVTLWKRDPKGSIQPLDGSDTLDLIIILTKKDKNLGLFIFSKSILIEKGILNTPNKGGKRGFRVYPSWDKTTNRQAQRSQDWQSDYFIQFDILNASIPKLLRLFDLHSESSDFN
ncbi:MepB family protein [Reichenbachiella agarivorans]|uniref:MepB family protein n=1 Tax=Reichenbachiella agarivorans TaxID=2979464 RepID=A0ABY6CL43_9BACT|nr:MepB family protein [Reichenbachiella agarivorans]UXP31235.1 MepB family protein [Reichenbachiella agarivorans]